MTRIRRTSAAVLGVLATAGLIYTAILWIDSSRDCSDPNTFCDGVFLALRLGLLIEGLTLSAAAILWVAPRNRRRAFSAILGLAGLMAWLAPLTVFRTCQNWTEVRPSVGGSVFVEVTECVIERDASLWALVGGLILMLAAVGIWSPSVKARQPTEG